MGERLVAGEGEKEDDWGRERDEKGRRQASTIEDDKDVWTLLVGLGEIGKCNRVKTPARWYPDRSLISAARDLSRVSGQGIKRFMDREIEIVRTTIGQALNFCSIRGSENASELVSRINYPYSLTSWSLPRHPVPNPSCSELRKHRLDLICATRVRDSEHDAKTQRTADRCTGARVFLHRKIQKVNVGGAQNMSGVWHTSTSQAVQSTAALGGKWGDKMRSAVRVHCLLLSSVEEGTEAHSFGRQKMRLRLEDQLARRPL